MKEQCVNQVKQLIEAWTDESHAYAYRSRLGRAVLSCLMLVAKDLKISSPKTPQLFQPPPEAPSILASIIQSCNKIWELGRVLSQPSEPLAERWNSGWSELKKELVLLYSHLQSYSSSTS
jgi:hypothetical protein